MIYLFVAGYLVIAFVTMVFVARLIVVSEQKFQEELSAYHSGEVEKPEMDFYAAAIITAIGAGAIWPLAVLGLLVARVAFPHLFVKKTREEA